MSGPGVSEGYLNHEGLKLPVRRSCALLYRLHPDRRPRPCPHVNGAHTTFAWTNSILRWETRDKIEGFLVRCLVATNTNKNTTH